MALAKLPPEVASFTPGYVWRLDLDLLFSGQRPVDWSAWQVRMHVWIGNVAFSLATGAGVTLEPVEGLSGATEAIVIPVLRLKPAQTLALAPFASVNYVIDAAGPGGEFEQFFGGTLSRVLGPPTELLM